MTSAPTADLLSVLLPLMGLLLALALVLLGGHRLRLFVARLCLSLFSLLLAFLALEIVHIQAYIRTDAFAQTLASQRWLELHFSEPRNSLGYRDREHSPESFASHRTVLVVGDSFAAGYGVEDHRDRFSDVLGAELGEEWLVANATKPGWNTGQELDAIESFPHRPDTIVLSYYVNDIEGAASAVGFPSPVKIPRPWGLTRLLTEHSFVLNSLYWKLFRFRDGEEMGRRYTEYQSRCYEDPAVWKAHEEELQELIRRTRERDQDLFVVLFPRLTDLEGTAATTSRVAEVFEREGVEVLDLAPVLAGRDPSSLVVNPFDAHPNAALHREVGELLAGRLSGLLSGD